MPDEPRVLADLDWLVEAAAPADGPELKRGEVAGVALLAGEHMRELLTVRDKAAALVLAFEADEPSVSQSAWLAFKALREALRDARYPSAADEAERAARQEAGATDSGYNGRYVAALAKRGFRLLQVKDEIAFRQAHPDWLMPPFPYPEGEPYPYPSFIVQAEDASNG